MRRPATTWASTLLAVTLLLLGAAVPGWAASQDRVFFGPELFVQDSEAPDLIARPFTLPGAGPTPVTLCLLSVDPKAKEPRPPRCRVRPAHPDEEDDPTDQQKGKGQSKKGGHSKGEAVARVWIDGVEVVTPEDFTPNRRFVAKVLSLASGTHTLQVELLGPLDSRLLVMLVGRVPLGNLVQARAGHTATLLADGTVLLTGGQGKKKKTAVLTSAEQWDPRILQSTPLGEELTTPRVEHTATLLPTKDVLLVSGQDPDGVLIGAERLQPSASFSALPATLEIPRSGHTATLLLDGRVLLLGGVDASTLVLAEGEQFAPTAEPGLLYDPRTGVFTLLPHALVVPRHQHTATLLPSGQVLVVGGYNEHGKALKSAELVNPATGMSTLLAARLRKGRAQHTASLLNDGRVLIAGGAKGEGALHTVEMFDSASQIFSKQRPRLRRARRNHTATVLHTGEILLAGGRKGKKPQAHTELYDQPTADATPPTVMAQRPTPDATGVPEESFTSVRFSEPIDVTTLTADSLTLTDSAGSVIAGTVSPGEEGLLAFFVPASALDAGATYTLTVQGLTDRAGNPLAPVSSAFTTITPPPELASFAPPQGSPGDDVTISGKNFLEVSSVTFNGVAATMFTVNNETSITATVPARATTGRITVTTAGGTDTSSTNFEVILGPTISDFDPKTASNGEQVTIKGSGLVSPSGGVAQVTLARQGGGTIGAVVASADATTIVFTVPTGAGTGLVTVTVDGEALTTSQPLTIVASRNYSLTVEPSSADVLQGQSVSYAVNLASTSGFTQLATLEVSGLPTGMTATFQPQQITAGQTAVLTVTASSGQALGPSTLSVSASATVEGLALTETATATLTVQPVTTAFLGRTVVADPLQPPLAGVTVTLLGLDGEGNLTGCAGQTVSDAAGNFALTNLPSSCVGDQLIRYDGTTATSPPGQFAGVDLIYTIVADQATVSPVLVHLPRIDNAETVQVQQNHPVDQTFTFQTIPNLSVTVYAGTIFTLVDGTQPNPFPLTAIQVAVDRLPEEMPPNTETLGAFIVAFQPANATASQPVAVSFPNLLNTAPGIQVTLSTLDPTQGTMVTYGTGTVSEDGTQVIPDFDPATPGRRFGLVHFDWHGPVQPPDPENPSPESNPPQGGDPVDLSSGLLVVRKTDMVIPGRGGGISMQRTYRTLSTAAGPFGNGTNHTYGYRLNTNFPQLGGVVNLIVPDGNLFPFVRGTDGTLTNEGIPLLRGAVMTVAPDDQVDLRWQDGTVFHFVPTTFQFGAALESVTDANGNRITLVRNPERPAQITAISDPVGRTLTLSYDAADRITSIADPIGRIVQYAYNAQGTLVTVTDPEGGVTRYDYDAQNRLTQLTDARGIVFLQNTYDANGRVVEQLQADGGRWTFAYTLINPLVPLSPVQETTMTDPRGNSTTYRFNPQGFLLDVTDALGQTTQFARGSGTNLLLSTTDPLGRATTFTYDAAGNTETITDPDGNVTRFEYDPTFNKVTKITDVVNQETTFTYDPANGNLLTTTDPLNETTTITYNAFGQPTSVTDPLNNTTTFDFNADGNLITTTDPLGNQTQRPYDAVSRLITLTDPRGNSTTYRFNPQGFLLDVTDAL
ncbi:MAG: Ig-like domain-containing protein, partial [Gemmatimonadales bacterium]